MSLRGMVIAQATAWCPTRTGGNVLHALTRGKEPIGGGARGPGAIERIRASVGSGPAQGIAAEHRPGVGLSPNRALQLGSS